MLRETKGRTGSVKQSLAIRPIPLEYLCLGPSDGPSEIRKERTEETGMFERSQQIPVFPLVIYHTTARSTRRYEVYVMSENVRQKWKKHIVETQGLRKARQDANMVTLSFWKWGRYAMACD